jgi:hypothetical protein
MRDENYNKTKADAAAAAERGVGTEEEGDYRIAGTKAVGHSPTFVTH